MSQLQELQLGVRDFKLVPEKGLLFVAMSEMNIGSRLDSYITNVSILSILLTISVLIVYDAMGKERKTSKCNSTSIIYCGGSSNLSGKNN